MIAIIITLSAFALLRFAAKSKKQAPVYAPIVPAGLERQRKEREKAAREAEKAEQARQLACMELDHIEAQRAQLMALYDALEAERDAADTAQTRKNTLSGVSPGRYGADQYEEERRPQRGKGQGQRRND